MSTLAVSIVRTIEEARQKEEECKKLKSSPGENDEAVSCQRKVRALREKATKMLLQYQTLKSEKADL